jgi:hypothetical protein
MTKAIINALHHFAFDYFAPVGPRRPDVARGTLKSLLGFTSSELP